MIKMSLKILLLCFITLISSAKYQAVVMKDSMKSMNSSQEMNKLSSDVKDEDFCDYIEKKDNKICLLHSCSSAYKKEACNLSDLWIYRRPTFNDNEKQPIVRQCHCVTYDKDSAVLETGKCVYSCPQNEHCTFSAFYKALSPNMERWTEDMCSMFNRSGTLCGKCRDGTHMRAYFYDLKCMECSNYGSNWWKYMLSAFLPLTIFFIIIVMFHINVHSSQLKGFVLFCQLISTPLYVCQLFLYIHVQPNLFYF